MAEPDAKEGFAGPTAASSAADGESESGPTEFAPAYEEEDFAEAMRRLDVARLALAADPEASFADCATRVLGGPWLLRTTGIPFDAVQGLARGEVAEEFCQRRDLQKNIRFEHSRYGGETSGILARAWFHRMQFLLNLELSGCLPRGRGFLAEDLTGYEEPSEFSRLFESADAHEQRRIEQIRSVPLGV